MPANFLHGVETIEVTTGPVPVNVVKTAVIGLIGTAPIQTLTNGDQSINTPTLVLNTVDAATYFGEDTEGYTIPAALSAIFAQGFGMAIVINVFDPSKHINATTGKPDPSMVTAMDIIGAVTTDGKRTGLQCCQDCYGLFGYFPKILIAPGYSTLNDVTVAMDSMAGIIKAISIVDSPVGVNPQMAIIGRGTSGLINFNISSDRTILCYPYVQAYSKAYGMNVLQPYSQFLAGVIAAKDISNGYWWSPSNTQIKGITGMERSLSAMINDPNSEVNLLNESGIVTIFNSYGSGLRTWGNRSSAYPTSTSPSNFIAVRRTADILEESISYAMLQFLDYPMSTALIDSICETVNSFIRSLVARGAIIDGNCSFDPSLNQATDLAAGHLTFDLSFMPPPPAERITFQSYIDISYLTELGGITNA